MNDEQVQITGGVIEGMILTGIHQQLYSIIELRIILSLSRSFLVILLILLSYLPDGTLKLKAIIL